MNDFIFGTLATDELRRARAEGLRAGITHNGQRSPRDPRPNQSIEIVLSLGPDHAGDRAWVYWSSDGQDPAGRLGQASHGQALEMTRVGEMWDTVLWGYVRQFRAVLPGQSDGTVLRYRCACAAAAGEETYADGGAFQAVYIADDPTPEWTRDAVVYQIFVDRFHPGPGRSWLEPADPGGFYGGTLRGITRNLDYLHDLGVNTLWLTPVFPSPTHHGYDTTDFFEIEPRLGTRADLRELLDEAHAGGLRVLLDLVPNHISNLHPAFQSAASAADSSTRGWFTFFDWPRRYETFFGVDSLPQLNLRHPAARQHVLDAARAWLDFGVDGYRVDYAIGPAAEFWADFRRVTRAAKPECWTFGEVVDPPDVQLGFEGGLDGCLDFMLLEALRQSTAFGRWDAARLASFLDRHEAYFPPTFSRPSFLDNHDMNRFLWAAGGSLDRLKLATLIQFTLAGPPVIYYGTEVGLSQERDVRQGTRGIPEEARLPMVWGASQNLELKAYYQSLVRLRQSCPAITHRTRQTLYADASLLIYRSGSGPDALTSVFNLSASDTQQVAVPPSSGQILVETGGVRLLDSGQSLEIPPLAGAALGAGHA